MDKENKLSKEIHLKFFDQETIAESKKKGVFEKIKTLFPFLIEKQSKEITRVGKIHAQLQQDAHVILTEVKTLKEKLKKELEDQQDNSHLWSCFETVINPLIREYSQIEKKKVDLLVTSDNSAGVIKSYEEWIEKAKTWVSLCSKPNDREGIIEAVIEHYLRISDDIIDRDLKTLTDYKQHELSNLGLDFEEIKLASTRLDTELMPHIQALLNLKHKKPQDLELNHLSIWKEKLDEDRAKYYHDALQTIDSIISEIAPAQIEEDKSEFLMDLYERIDYLEEELPIFLGHLERVDLRDDVKKQLLENQLVFLEDEVHKINQDLRLTPELEERVNSIICDLEKAHKFF